MFCASSIMHAPTARHDTATPNRRWTAAVQFRAPYRAPETREPSARLDSSTPAADFTPRSSAKATAMTSMAPKLTLRKMLTTMIAKLLGFEYTCLLASAVRPTGGGSVDFWM